MASAAYLAAAKQATAGKREPVVIVRVEDVGTIEEFYTTQADWEGSEVLTNIDSSWITGTAVNLVPCVKPGLASRWQPGPTVLESYYPKRVKGYITWPGSRGASIDFVLTAIYVDESSVSLRVGETPKTSAVGTLQASGEYRAQVDLLFLLNQQLIPIPNYSTDGPLFVVVGEYWGETAQFQVTPLETWGIYPSTVSHSLTTSTIDIGETPTSAARFEVDDIKPAGSSITYTAYADDFDPPTTSRGVVEDGDSIGVAGYRYYRIQADFATTNGAMGELQEIRIIGGDAQYKIFGTHKNLPSAGVLPILPPNPVGSLSSKIEIDKPTSVGELSFKLLWTKASGDMLATGYLRNKAIQIQHGFVGLSASDFETIFTGVWANYKADHVKRIIDVSTQNVLKKFMKVKLPRETVNETTWVKTTTPLVWSGVNAVQAILDLVEELGIPDRYLDRDTIEGLRDGALSSADYNVTRTITNPVEAWKLIHQLATLCGCFVVVLPTGKMTLVLYDAAATPGATFDARHVDFSQINGGQDQLYTRQIIYYAPNVTDPGESEADYDNARWRVNADSEIAYDESTEHRWFDQWGASTTVISSLADRWDTWQGTPRFTLAAKKVSNHQIEVLEGHIVWVTGLVVPVAAADFDTPQKFKALVTKRAFNPTSCTLDFELLQITDAEAA